MAFKSKLAQILGSKGFLIGLTLTALCYGGAFLWSGMTSDTHLETIEKSLAAQTISIQRLAGQLTEELVGEVTSIDAQHGDLLKDEIIEPPSPDHSKQAPSHQNEALNPKGAETYPLAGLFETTAGGDVLPVIRESDGMTAFKAYSTAQDNITGNTIIALVIDNVGLSPIMTEKLSAELPTEITFIVNPYSGNINSLEKQWHGAKREIWLKIPFESSDFPNDDPGMRGILTRASLSKNMDNFKWAIGRAHGYSGIAAGIDSAYIQSRPLLGTLAKEAFDRGLGYFELNNAAPPIIKDMADRQNAPYLRNEIMLQDPKWNGDLEEAAGLLETIAESKGFAIGVLQPYPETIDFIKDWASRLKQKDISLVPLSAIYTHRISAPQDNAALAAPVNPAVKTEAKEPTEALHDPAAH